MTLFAVACAAIFPLVHTGRPWLAIYWLFPYPNAMGAVAELPQPAHLGRLRGLDLRHGLAALLVRSGLIPDLATFRDKAEHPVLKKLFGVLAMGWRGSARHWARYEKAYLLLAGLSTPLVLSVHTVVSFDFAVSVLPGWHATIFPPYFVAGAIYAGFAMVLTLAIPLRAMFKLHDFITMRHIENMAKVTLVTGPDRRLRLRVRGVLRLVQRQRVRAVHAEEPHLLRAVRLVVLAAAALQLHRAAAAVVEADAPEHRRRCSPCACSSTSACGSSGSSSS